MIPRVLNLGSGRNFREDCINIDVSERAAPDVLWDLEKSIVGQTFDTERFGTVDLKPGFAIGIIAYDVLEHVHNLAGLMTDCVDMLEMGGTMEILVPYDLSYGAWQDPTHVRAFNQRSWVYYNEWSWYLGWQEANFEIAQLDYQYSEWGKLLHQKGTSQEDMLRTPRAVDSMTVVLRKQPLTQYDKMMLRKYEERLH